MSIPKISTHPFSPPTQISMLFICALISSPTPSSPSPPPPRNALKAPSTTLTRSSKHFHSTPLSTPDLAQI